MVDNALHLNDQDNQALAVSIASIVMRRIPKIEPFFVTREDIEFMLGDGLEASFIDDLLREPGFPKPFQQSSDGENTWKLTEVVEFFDQRFKEAAC